MTLNIFPSGSLAATFLGNNADYAGGGLFAGGSNVIAKVNVKSDFSTAPSLPPNKFVNNHSATMGGAVVAYAECELNISDAAIISNSSVSAAGAIIASGLCTAQFVNAVIAQNSSPLFASAFVGITNYLVNFKNCTIADNLSNAVVSLTTPLIEMESCIVWENSGEFALTNCGVEFSDIQGGWPGSFNINDDPMFADPGALDYQLLNGSLCIDAGASLGSVTNDCIGTPRPHGSRWDMGAYEFVPEPTGLLRNAKTINSFYFCQKPIKKSKIKINFLL